MEVLDGPSTRRRLKEMIARSTQLKIAVPFWGEGAIESLGVDAIAISVEVICNLASGACNPEEINALRSLNGVNVKTHDRLHAKIYWTPRAAVLGSSNVSSNGLAVEGKASLGWEEANVYAEQEAFVAVLDKRYEQLSKAAHDVSDEDIHLAFKRWDARRLIAPVSSTKESSELIDAYRVETDHALWRTIKVAFIREDLSKEAQTEYEADLASSPTLTRHYCIEGWQSELEAGDWVIVYEAIGKPSLHCEGVFRVGDPKLESEPLTWLAPVGGIDNPAFGHLRVGRRTGKALKDRGTLIQVRRSFIEPLGCLMRGS